MPLGFGLTFRSPWPIFSIAAVNACNEVRAVARRRYYHTILLIGYRPLHPGLLCAAHKTRKSSVRLVSARTLSFGVGAGLILEW